MKGYMLWGMVVAAALAGQSAVAGISGGGKPHARNAELVLVGPVEAIRERDNTVIVLGQKLPQRALGNVEVGETLAIFGTVRADGSIRVSDVVHQGLYVPGATNVLLTGVVQKVDASIGRAVVGGVSVDINTLIGLGESDAITVGSLVQLAGTQPVGGGLMLAAGISGGGLNGISGGGLNGISGGGLNGISGGGLNGISGGGLNGISGGGLNGISGGGLNGISGGGLNGISGGGLNGISGGGLNGISGGGLNGISGGGLNGISGGGLNGISGGGLNGISGGGLNGISGGGLNGISGGGLNGISGGGLNGISGGGLN